MPATQRTARLLLWICALLAILAILFYVRQQTDSTKPHSEAVVAAEGTQLSPESSANARTPSQVIFRTLSSTPRSPDSGGTSSASVQSSITPATDPDAPANPAPESPGQNVEVRIEKWTLPPWKPVFTYDQLRSWSASHAVAAFSTNVTITNGSDTLTANSILESVLPGYANAGARRCRSVDIYRWTGDGRSYARQRSLFAIARLPELKSGDVLICYQEGIEIVR